MIAQLQANCCYAVHLRCPSASGGKDWVGSITTSNQIHSDWGKTGRINQHSGRPGTILDLDRAIANKIAKGYREVDRFNSESGWLSRKSSTAPNELPPGYRPVVKLPLPCPESLVFDF